MGNGEACVADEYLAGTNQYRVTVESSKEVLMISPQKLKRRDRTPNDCGYFVEFKNGTTIRHELASKEECRAFLASFDGPNSRPPAVDADAEARAEQAAFDLLAELGIEEGEKGSGGRQERGSRPAAGKSNKK